MLAGTHIRIASSGSTLFNPFNCVKNSVGEVFRITLNDYIRGIIDAIATSREDNIVILEVTRAGIYKLLREDLLRDFIVSEEPFIENNGEEIVVGYKVRLRYNNIEELKDPYDYLAGCLDAGLVDVRRRNDKLVLELKCRNANTVLKLFRVVENNGKITLQLDTKEIEKVLPRLHNSYVALKIRALYNNDLEDYHRIVREEFQADEVLGQLAVEEILYSSRSEEYKKILSIKPEEARFQQKLIRELIGCGR